MKHLNDLIEVHKHQLLTSQIKASISVEETVLDGIVLLKLDRIYDHIGETFTVGDIYKNHFEGYFKEEDAAAVIQEARFIFDHPEDSDVSTVKEVWEVFFGDYLIYSLVEQQIADFKAENKEFEEIDSRMEMIDGL